MLIDIEIDYYIFTSSFLAALSAISRRRPASNADFYS
jgi:hypothetical protein